MLTADSSHPALRHLCQLLIILACLLLAPALPAGAQYEFEQTIETTLADTTETFWAQIPAGYDPAVPCPLLIGWHQLGGSHLEMKLSTQYDEIANERGWIVACHSGVGSTHWNNHPTQSHVVDVIRWISDHYSVDPDRIYMVGGSMGGAAGMIFSNNHLDPDGPLVAAAASLSGIQDCERRFHEQGINHSMTEAFGGSPEEVPYEYHRNSAIYFADSTESMHFNARHLPLWLTFGYGDSDQIWREHAEDLFAVMNGFADTVVLRESENEGHGWGVHEEDLICDFLSGFSLQRRPVAISVNADEEGVWYWTEIRMREPVESFARLEARADVATQHVQVFMIRNIAAATLDLPSLGFAYGGEFTCRWAIEDDAAADLAFRGVPEPPVLVMRNGIPYADWTYDAFDGLLTLSGSGDATYRIIFNPAGSSDAQYPIAQRALPGILLASEAERALSEIATGWTLFDAQGRAAAGRARGRAAGISDERLGWAYGTGAVELNQLPSGTYLLRLDSSVKGDKPRVYHVTIVR